MLDGPGQIEAMRYSALVAQFAVFGLLAGAVFAEPIQREVIGAALFLQGVALAAEFAAWYYGRRL